MDVFGGLQQLLERAVPDLGDRLHLAAGIGLRFACRLLLEGMAEPNTWQFRADRGSEGCFGFAMGEAIYRGHGDPVRVLLKGGAQLFAGLMEEPRAQAASTTAAQLRGKRKRSVTASHENVVPGVAFMGLHTDPMQAALRYAEEDKTGPLGALMTVDAFRPPHANQAWGTAPGTPLDPTALLSVALEKGSLGAVRILVGHGAQVQAADLKAGGALRQAAAAGDEQTVELLLHAGAPVRGQHAADSGGRTAVFFTAATEGGERVCSMLVAAKAEVNEAALSGRRPLHMAAQGGNHKVAKVLLEAKADVEAEDAHGLRALHNASIKGHLQVVKLLIHMGADAEAQDKLGRTPSLCAREFGHEELLKLIEELTSGGAAQTPSPRCSD